MSRLGRQLAEADGSPSNNRTILFIFMMEVVILLAAMVIIPICVHGFSALKIPEVPQSFVNLILGLAAIFTGSSAIGKGAEAYRNKGSRMVCESEEGEEVNPKDLPDDER